MEFKDFLLEYWYVILVALYFLFPVLSRIQDCISGKAKRHNQERLLAEKECLLSRKERELAEQAKEEVTFYDIEKEMNQYCHDQNEGRICQQECDTCGIKYILANYNLTRKDNK